MIIVMIIIIIIIIVILIVIIVIIASEDVESRTLGSRTLNFSVDVNTSVMWS